MPLPPSDRSIDVGPELCALHHAGHNVHWIQVLVVGRDTSGVPARVVGLADREILLEIEGDVVRYLNHDVPRLTELVASRGRDVFLQFRGNVLYVPEKGRSSCFSLASPLEPWRHCQPEWIPPDTHDETPEGVSIGELAEIDSRAAYEALRPIRDRRIAEGETTPAWEALQWARTLDFWGTGWNPDDWPEEAALLATLSEAEIDE